MSEPYVSSFDKRFMAAFSAGSENIPVDQSKTVKDILDKIHERVISDLEYYIAENIKENAADAIRSEAAAVAVTTPAVVPIFRGTFGFCDTDALTTARP